ncbi:MAG: molybdate ABC transporter substrate-binding protein [Burkholderiaceae bacterium]|nr:molybdate ABC transporter substrate-binding protein [Burkholderiaceae bacterium]
MTDRAETGRLQSVALALSLTSGLCAAAPVVAAEITVSAAASLTQAFKAIESAFERQRPGTDVVLNFGASDVVLQQIMAGAPVDVFASADQVAMDRAVAASAVVAATRIDFATNRLVVIVPEARAKSLTSVKSLADASVRRVAYGNPASVPVGRYAQAALQRDGLWDAVSAKGIPAQNVRQALDYVARGEVDAGIVFATDAAVMPHAVRIAAELPSVAPVTYPIARTTSAQEVREADAFVAFVRSTDGQRILAEHGFGRAP